MQFAKPNSVPATDPSSETPLNAAGGVGASGGAPQQEESFKLGDGRCVCQSDYLALKRLERANGIEIDRLEDRIEVLDGQGRIKVLDLSWLGHADELTTLSELRGLELERLRVSMNRGLKSLAGLEGMSTLRELDASDCRGSTMLSELRGLELRRLSVSKNSDLTSLAGLEGMSTLRELEASDCDLESLRDLAGLNLTVLFIPGNRSLSSLGGLEGMATLESLCVVDCGLRSLQELRGTGLKILDVSFNWDLGSLNGLQEVRTLRALAACNCRLTSVQELSGLPLEELAVGGNRLHDLCGLEKMTTLRELMVSENELTSVAPIRELAFERLCVDGNPALGSLDGINISALCSLSAHDCGLSADEQARWVERLGTRFMRSK